MPPEKEASNCPFDTIKEGQIETFDYLVTRDIFELFIATFGDRSPLHIDPVYARAAGFSDPVMHGTILNGFLSHFVGMVFPGRPAMLLSVDLRYLQPCFVGDEFRLTATVALILESRRVLVLQVRFTRPKDGILVAAGKVHVLVRNV